jgi:hypothetical protein
MTVDLPTFKSSCQDIITKADADKKFFNRIIMGDETWCFAYDPETKRQSSEWLGETSPGPKKLKFQRSHIKTKLIIFFDSQGVVHKEFVPEGKADVSLPDYFLFPKLKVRLKGLHFADVAEIQEAVTDELKKVQKEEFSAAFQKLYDHAKACIYASRAYFE